MRVHIATPEVRSPCLQRITDNLIKFAPAHITIVRSQPEAELVIFHVIGRRNHAWRDAQWAMNRGIKFALVQECLRSTMNPSTKDWRQLWDHSALTWSYYPLDQWCDEDGEPPVPNFYHAPLGADAQTFQYRPADQPKYLIATTGLAATAEGVRECAIAAEQSAGRMFHLGPRVRSSWPHVDFFSGITDAHLATLYQDSRYVCGLRRTEGFEMPCAEGLLCGALPILFNKLHYQQWYGDLGAFFIEEGTRADVERSLLYLFANRPRPITPEQLARARTRFDWQRIIEGFWSRL
jgi:hypothetical protein